MLSEQFLILFFLLWEQGFSSKTTKAAQILVYSPVFGHYSSRMWSIKNRRYLLFLRSWFLLPSQSCAHSLSFSLLLLLSLSLSLSHLQPAHMLQFNTAIILQLCWDTGVTLTSDKSILQIYLRAHSHAQAQTSLIRSTAWLVVGKQYMGKIFPAHRHIAHFSPLPLKTDKPTAWALLRIRL